MRVRKKGRRASAVGTKDEKRGNVVCKYSRLKKRINKHQERAIVQSAAAFTLGLILSFLCFYILTFERGLDVRLAVGVSCSLAVVLSLGMAFSGMFRCLITLVFPSFLTSEGRLVMLTYATILLVCGPLRNIEQNFENTSASLSCGAEVALNQTREIMQRAAAPLLSAVDQLKAIGEKMKDICDKAQSIFRTFGAACSICR
uniref:Uncharacterized protein n=1 Tax=Eptatretus burgeri TaxID=7764 RepID=A0A8C4R859_EPTBU